MSQVILFICMIVTIENACVQKYIFYREYYRCVSRKFAPLLNDKTKRVTLCFMLSEHTHFHCENSYSLNNLS